MSAAVIDLFVYRATGQQVPAIRPSPAPAAPIAPRIPTGTAVRAYSPATAAWDIGYVVAWRHCQRTGVAEVALVQFGIARGWARCFVPASFLRKAV